MSRGQAVWGTFVFEFASPSVPRILSVPGLDVALIGPYDLSASMGIPGDMNHPRMQRAIEAFLKSCRQHGVVPGNFVATVEDGRAWLRQGMRFLIYSVDFLLVMARSRQVLSELRPKGRTDDKGPR